MEKKALEERRLFEGLSVVHFKFFGLWAGINDYRTSGKTSWIFKSNMALSLLYVSPFIFFQFLCTFLVSVDIKMGAFIYLNGISSVQVWFKILMFWTRLDDHCLLFDLLRVDFLSCVPKEKAPRVRRMYKDTARRCNAFSVLAFAANVLTIVTWLLMPGFDTRPDGRGRKKILGGWYPVPYSESPWYEVVFAYEMVLTSWHGCLVSLYECVLLIPLISLYAHFLVLGYHISTLKVVGEGAESISTLNTELKKAMDDYKKLLWFADKFRRTNNPVVTSMLGLDIGVLISTLLYILFGASDALSTFKLMLFVGFAAIEVSLVCVSSSLVGSASSEIGYCLYCSDWYRAGKKFAVAGQLTMVRSSRPVTLTAVKMYPVNMETWLSIFRFIYSTVALFAKMKE